MYAYAAGCKNQFALGMERYREDHLMICRMYE